MFVDLLLLALAGAAGTLARYALAILGLRAFGDDFPWSTLLVNTLGCFLFGLLWALADDRAWLSPAARLTLLTGFLGAFTTYSTFAFETGRLMEQARWLAALANVGLQLAAGMIALFCGFALGRYRL